MTCDTETETYMNSKVFTRNKNLWIHGIPASNTGPLHDPVMWYKINHAGPQPQAHKKVVLQAHDLLDFWEKYTGKVYWYII